MRHLRLITFALAGLSALALAGAIPALAQTGAADLVPIDGYDWLIRSGELDSSPRYGIIHTPRPGGLPEVEPPENVKPVEPGDPPTFSSASKGVAAESIRESAASPSANLSGSRSFAGATSVAVLPDREVDVRRVRNELADLRAELGL